MTAWWCQTRKEFDVNDSTATNVLLKENRASFFLIVWDLLDLGPYASHGLDDFIVNVLGKRE